MATSIRYTGKDVAQLLECSVCLDSFSKKKVPKMLSCSHNVCVQCLQELVSGQELVCPLCREETAVPHDDVNKLPTNLVLLQFVDIQPLSKCQSCGQEKKNKKCFHCGQIICSECLKDHTEVTQRIMGQMEQHLAESLQATSEFQESLLTRIRTVKSEKNTSITKIKQHCQILIDTINARQHVLIEDTTQKFNTMKDQYDGIKAALDSRVESMTSLKQQINSALPELQSTTKDIIDKLCTDFDGISTSSLNTLQTSTIAFSTYSINSKIDKLKRDIQNWGDIKAGADTLVTCTRIPAPFDRKYLRSFPHSPVDYSQKGKLLRQITCWQQGSQQNNFKNPYGVALDIANSELFVCDNMSHQVHVFTLEGEYCRSFGKNGKELGQFSYPWNVCVNSTGEIIVADTINMRCQIFTSDGKVIKQFGQEGSGKGELNEPTDVTVDDKGNIYVTSNGDNCIKIYDKYCAYQTSFGTLGKGQGQFEYPYCIKWFMSKCVVRDRNGVQLFSDCGKFIRSIGAITDREPLIKPFGVTADQQGQILVVDAGDKTVKVYTAEGDFVTKFTVAEFNGSGGFITCSPDGTVILTKSKSVLWY